MERARLCLYRHLGALSVFRLAQVVLGLDIITECGFKYKIYAIDKP